MNPLVFRMADDAYPTVAFTQSHTTIGSFARDTRLRIGFSGTSLVADNTAPPASSQTNLYSQTAFTATAQYFPAGTLNGTIPDNYQWRVTGLNKMAVSGVTEDAWNDFNASGLDAATFVIDSPITGTPRYHVEIREKQSTRVVADFTYTLDGY